MTRWIVLDVDDTLVRTFEVGLLKCRRVAEELGLELPSKRDLKRYYGRESFERCIELLHPGVDVAAYQVAYDRLQEELADRPVGDIRGVVRWARGSGIRIGILTNGPRSKTRRKLASVGVDESELDFVCDADSSGLRKPDVRAFTRLATQFGFEPGNALFVSDSPNECAAAAKGGFRTAGVLTGVWREEDFGRSEHPPDWILADVAELPRVAS